MRASATLTAAIVGVFFGVVAFSSVAAIEVYEFKNAQQQEDFAILVQELRCPK